MKIKFFILASSKAFLNKGGGGSKSLLLLAHELASNNHDVNIICLSNEDKQFNFCFKNKKILIKEYKINKFAFLLVTPFLPSLYRIVRKEGLDAEILHFYNVQLDPLAGLYKVFNKNKKTISTLNNYYYVSPNFECGLNGRVIYKYNFFEKMLAFLDLFKQNYDSTKVFLLAFLTPLLSFFYTLNIFLSKKIGSYTTLSETAKEVYCSNGFKNIKVVPNMFDSIFSVKNHAVRKKKIVLFVGRIKRAKGVEDLILAFKKSNLQKKGYTLRIVGSGNQLEYLRSKYCEKNIIFLGNIPYFSVKKEYQIAEIFVHPAVLPEPFGRTILEAIQNNCKMLVSNIGEPPQIVKKKECIYQYKDEEELAEKLELLSYNKELGFVSRRVLENYSPSEIVKLYEEAYRKL
jgi:glycosyltransferase involved in cell wall biosynthesis